MYMCDIKQSDDTFQLHALDIITSPFFTNKRIPTGDAMLSTTNMELLFQCLGNAVIYIAATILGLIIRSGTYGSGF